MADPGYNDHFVICLTPNRGTNAIINPATINLFFNLNKKEMSISDLVERTGLPKNTVRDKIQNMMDKGLIESRTDENDSRRILYRICSFPLIIDNNYMVWDYPPIEPFDEDILQNEEHFRQYRFGMIIRYFAESGLDFRPMLFEMGSTMGTFLYNHRPATQKFKWERLNLGGILNTKIDIEYKGDMRVSLSSDSTIDEYNTLYLIALLGSGTSLIPQLSGHNYSHIARNRVPGNKSLPVITLPRFEGAYFKDQLPDIPDRPPDFYRCREPFIMIEVEKHSYMVTNKIMMSILERVNGPVSSNEIMKGMDCSRIAFFAGLNKLLKIGALKPADQSKQRDRVFLPNFQVILRSATPTMNDLADLPKIVLESPRISDEIHHMMDTYIKYMINCIGLDVSPIINRAYHDASEEIATRYPGDTKMEFLKKLSMLFRDSLVFDFQEGTVTVSPENDIMTCYQEIGIAKDLVSEYLLRFEGQDVQVEYRFGKNLP